MIEVRICSRGRKNGYDMERKYDELAELIGIPRYLIKPYLDIRKGMSVDMAMNKHGLPIEAAVDILYNEELFISESKKYDLL